MESLSTHEQLVAHLERFHVSLAPLLPSDVSCDDLFGEVDAGRPIKSQFNPSEDSQIDREMLRFTRKIELWLVEEKAKGKATPQAMEGWKRIDGVDSPSR